MIEVLTFSPILGHMVTIFYKIWKNLSSMASSRKYFIRYYEIVKNCVRKIKWSYDYLSSFVAFVLFPYLWKNILLIHNKFSVLLSFNNSYYISLSFDIHASKHLALQLKITNFQYQWFSFRLKYIAHKERSSKKSDLYLN